MGAVAQTGALRVRLRRARQKHGSGDSDGEDLGRVGEGGDEHGGALQREETLAISARNLTYISCTSLKMYMRSI